MGTVINPNRRAQVQSRANAIAQRAMYSPNQGNFNQWVQYARGAMNQGRTPNAQGFMQAQGPAGAPGGGKNPQVAPQPQYNPHAQPVMGRNQLLARALVK